MGSTHLLLLVSCCVVASARSAENLISNKWPEFRSDYTYWPEAGGWLKLHRVPQEWNVARKQCYHEGAVLASPLSEELHNAMMTTLSRSNALYKNIFTGVSATLSHGVFTSVEGYPLERLYIKWAKEAYNENDGQCLIYEGDIITFGDCSEPLPFICFRQVTVTHELTECGTVDKDYKLDARTGSCYKFHTRAATWRWAARVCSAEGGHLAVIDSYAEADVLKELFANNPKLLYTAYQNSAAIGFSKWLSDSWWTIHGKPIEESGYSNWGAGQPDNAGGKQACGAVFRNLVLDDMDCDQPIAFICEKLPQSLLYNTFSKNISNMLEDGYAVWHQGEPDNAGGGQDCGAIFRNALLDDIWCDRPIAYICEKTPQSLRQYTHNNSSYISGSFWR